MENANRDLKSWLARKEQRVHGTTHEVVYTRFLREQPSLNALPQKPFDTSYRAYRKVHKDCTIRFEGNSFVVPHQHVDEQVTLRVKDERLRILVNNELIALYQIPEGKGHLVQHRRFYQALRDDHKMNQRKFHRADQRKGRAKRTKGLSKPRYEMDVEVRPIATYHDIAETSS